MRPCSPFAPVSRLSSRGSALAAQRPLPFGDIPGPDGPDSDAGAGGVIEPQMCPKLVGVVDRAKSFSVSNDLLGFVFAEIRPADAARCLDHGARWIVIGGKRPMPPPRDQKPVEIASIGHAHVAGERNDFVAPQITQIDPIAPLHRSRSFRSG